MQVMVEFFGIPRVRAGVPHTVAEGDSLGDVLADLAQRFPALAAACIEGRTLKPGYTVNLGGEKFVTDSATPLREGESILVMSLDAGG